MNPMEKLGRQLATAIDAGVPHELAANVAATSHAGRLQALFLEASRRLLREHRAAKLRPSSRPAQLERDRAKALLDLVRARSAAIGAKKLAVPKLMALMDTEDQKVVPIRKAA